MSPKVKVRKPVIVNAEKADRTTYIETLEGRMKAEKAIGL